MQGADVFCERCGTPQPMPEVAAPRSAGVLARRVLDAVGITDNQPAPAEDWLRLCLSCRGYSCPACWNDAAGVCQTCEPVPEPIVEVAPEPIPYWVSQLEPLVAPRDAEPVVDAGPQPVDVLDPDPVFAELALVPEPEPEPVERPRMPVLPLPPPRPADAPAIPLPPLPSYPVAPQISFSAQVSVAASSQTSAPAYEAHLLLAPPPELPAHAIAAGLRPCPSCRLTLSARAQFCRRCGAAQAH